MPGGRPKKRGTSGSPSLYRAPDTLLGKELDPCHVGAITLPVTQLQDPGISARPGREPGTNLTKQPAQSFPVLDSAFHQAAGMQVSPPGQGDQLFGKGAQLLGLGLGGDDAAMLEETGSHVVQHGTLVTRRAGELPAL